MPIYLTPDGRLVWDAAAGDETAAAGGGSAWPALARAFRRDWREGLFTLAAGRAELPATAATLRYWRRFAEHYLTALCHLPADVELTDEPALRPPAELFGQLALVAPPMTGGEYLTAGLLAAIWRELHGWTVAAAGEAGGVRALLGARAPQWHQVGRVCFHLAENKNDEQRPFAFLATYAEGFGAAGRVRHLPLRDALTRYAGARDRAALIRLLAPVQQAAERCGWLAGLVESGAVYQPLAWNASQAYRLLRSVPELEAGGLTVRLPDWWYRRPRPQVAVTLGERRQTTFGVGAMLDFDLRVALGDEPLDDDELARLLDSDEPLVQLRGRWVEVDAERLREALAQWREVQRQARYGEISFIEGMRLLAGAGPDLDVADEDDPARVWAHVSAGAGLREVLARLRDPARLTEDGVTDGRIAGLHGTLRPYQREGVAWLRLLTGLQLGACLADDMGLGKTVQLLALLLLLAGEPGAAGDGAKPAQRAAAARGRGAGKTDDTAPSLLVLPASLLGNWMAEAARFAPSLRLLALHPSETPRTRLAAVSAAPRRELAGVDLVLTTYAMLSRQSWLAERRWRLVILDEAQTIKNPGARQTRAVKQLRASARVALTGTPVENRLGDLWSLFDFLNPGLLGSRAAFKSFVGKLQRREREQFAPLRRLVAPYILRRLKTDREIIADLPDKIETACYCALGKRQVKLYRQSVQSLQKALAELDGIERRGLVLQTLMRLKQICNHPSQLTGDGDYRPADSGKFQRLTAIAEELAGRQQRVLVFTQFREIIDPLADCLRDAFGRDGLTLHGGTGVRRRQQRVDSFQRDDGPPFFVLSLKAGGTGLNLTAASQVIHFDRWWNPAVENQATDRAFRIGQRRNVLVHKFITRGTVEERIDALIAEKRELADGILGAGAEVDLTGLPDDELLRLVRLDIARASV